MRIMAVAIAGLFAFATPALSQQWPQSNAESEPEGYVVVYQGYITGEEYLSFSQAGRLGYVTGAVDGLIGSSLLYANPKRVAWLVSCVGSRSNTQVEAMTSKWLSDNPGRWNEGAHSAVYSALLTVCPIL